MVEVNSQCLKCEDGKLLPDQCNICSRRVRLFHTLLNARPDEIKSGISQGLGRMPVDAALGTRPTVEEVEHTLQARVSNKAVRPDDLPTELLKIGHTQGNTRNIDGSSQHHRGHLAWERGTPEAEGCRHEGAVQEER